MNFSAGKELEISINKIENELKEDLEDECEYEEKEVQTLPFPLERQRVESRQQITKDILIDEPQPRNSIVQSPLISTLKSPDISDSGNEFKLEIKKKIVSEM